MANLYRRLLEGLGVRVALAVIQIESYPVNSAPSALQNIFSGWPGPQKYTNNTALARSMAWPKLDLRGFGLSFVNGVAAQPGSLKRAQRA